MRDETPHTSPTPQPRRTHKSVVAQHPALGALILAPLFAGLVWYLSDKADVLHISLAIMAGCALVATAAAEVRLVRCSGLVAWCTRALWDAAWFAAVLGAVFAGQITLWGCLAAGFFYSVSMALLQNAATTGLETPPRILWLLPVASLGAGIVLTLLGVHADWTVWVMFVLLCVPQKRDFRLAEVSLQHWLWTAVFTAAAIAAGVELVTG